MSAFSKVTSTVVVLPADDVDTDQIIPARFLKGTDKRGLGAHLFSDWREQPGFPLLAPGAKDAEVLVAGVNFGCGSSREHAPWALTDWGFRVIIARSFADIFRQNATKNGLLPVALEDAACARIEELVRKAPETRVEVDLATQRVTLPDGAAFAFEIDPFAKHCMLEGLDELGYILSFEERIVQHERRLA
jgi:3-isopropylmalate/(R)-2-methylmalate dehydratase small subunit